MRGLIRRINIRKTSFGTTKNGCAASTYEIGNGRGVRLIATDFGATVVSIFVKDKNGTERDVILGYDDFWTNVRVKGGAYGCMSNFNRNGDFAFVSYRDPNLTKTIEVFEKTADYLRNFDVDDRDMTKFIIGTISAMDTPLTPSQKGSRAVHAYFSEITYDELQEERLQVINATQQDVRDLAKCIEDAMSQNYLCVVGNEDAITENEDVFEKIQPLFSEVEDE